MFFLLAGGSVAKYITFLLIKTIFIFNSRQWHM